MGENMFKKFSKKHTINKTEANHTHTLTRSLESNISLFENIFSDDQLLISRRFQNKDFPDIKCCVLYFDGMINTERINEDIIKPILSYESTRGISTNYLLEELTYKVIRANKLKTSEDISEIVGSVIYGDTVFMLEGYSEVIIIDTKGWQTRAITEPDSSKVVRGPREGFTESILINTSLLRRKIVNSDLKFIYKEIGERTHTKTCICYIEGLALEGVLEELKQRLDRIKIDGILDSGYIQELIQDAPYSPYPTVGCSERPDVIAANLLEGRVALFVNGSPFVLSVPYILAEAAQTNEDYYNNFIFASINRLLRALAPILAISIPAVFLAVVTFHQETLPTQLLLSISASRQGVPFPTSLSLFMMLIIFDILREAGTRMPAAIGQAVNIVGTLILGQAAVEAKLVSAPVIIITALSGILTMMNSSLIGATIILRFFLLLAASILGIYGYLFGIIVIILHLLNIRSFGVPYMLNISTIKNHNYQDTWIRAPWWSMILRPKIIAAKNLKRQSTGSNRGKR